MATAGANASLDAGDGRGVCAPMLTSGDDADVDVGANEYTAKCVAPFWLATAGCAAASFCDSTAALRLGRRGRSIDASALRVLRAQRKIGF